VSIGSKDGAAVAEAQRRIELILDPPSAEVGAVYEGRVVNITKFGAFVNILPGRDGLIHISKLGRGKRIDRVEDVLALGDELSVRVDDIDQNGKLSLSLLGEDGDEPGGGGNGDGGRGREREPRAPRGDRPPRESRESRESRDSGGARESRESREPASDTRVTASFESAWEEQAREEFGDLGPAEEPAKSAAGDRRGGRGGRGGGARRGGPRR
jgi:polyribonucleotide nucleotidyltransferase